MEENSPAPATTEKKKKNVKKIVIIAICAVLAGLGIFLIVNALSDSFKSAQAGERDRKRRDDYSAIVSNVSKLIEENDNKFPDVLKINPTTLIESGAKDPSGENYTLRILICGSGYVACPGTPKLVETEVYLIKNAKCDNERLVKDEDDTAFVVWGYQETKNPVCISPSESQ